MKWFIHMTCSDLLWGHSLAQANWVELVAHIELGCLEGRGFNLSHGANLTLDRTEWAEMIWLCDGGRHIWTDKIISRCGTSRCHWTLVNSLKCQTTGCTCGALILQALRELFEILLEFVVLVLIVLQTLLVWLVSLISVLKRGRCYRITHPVSVFFV